MCHQTVRPTSSGQSQASGDDPPPQRDEEPDPAPAPEEEEEEGGDQNPGNDTTREEQSDNEATDPVEQQQQEEEEEREGSGLGEHEDKPADSHSEAAQGLRFSSSGDFVGFISPVSSGDVSSSHVQLGATPNALFEENCIDSPLPSTHDAADSELSGPRCDGTSKSRFDPSASNSTDISWDSQTRGKSCNQNCNDHPQNHKVNSTYSDRESEPSSDATFCYTSTDGGE